MTDDSTQNKGFPAIPEEDQKTIGERASVQSESLDFQHAPKHLLAAWFTTRFERDKHLVALASAGIGLLITLLSSLGSTSKFQTGMYLISILSFIVTIAVGLFIFNYNAKYLETVMKEDDENSHESGTLLKWLDIIITLSFGIAIISAACIGLSKLFCST